MDEEGDALAESHAAVPPWLLAQLTNFENVAGLYSTSVMGQ